MATYEELREVKRRHSPDLLRQTGVCGFGIEKDEAGEYILALHLDTDDPAVAERLPKQIEGHPIKLHLKSGPFHKLRPAKSAPRGS